MKLFLLLSVALFSFLTSAVGPAYASQDGDRLDALRKYVENYQEEPFMNSERLAQLEDARRSKDIMRVNGFNRVRQEAAATQRAMARRIVDLREAISMGNLSEAQLHFNSLGVFQQRLDQQAKNWASINPQQIYTETQMRDIEPVDGTPPPSPSEVPAPPGPPGPEVTTTSPPPPPPPPSVLGLSLTTPVVVTSVAVAVGVGVAVNKSGDDTTDTTGGNE
ncbi:hypothetical protein CWE22_05585 [Pseudidiomarina aestuarii]|uniref:Uncharacterized protein n=1 Tax=Pseudidiomarina aestuarii TaxID=624146 RepID=A0A7Z6ZUI0_9GAMM|nr:hypothetical protein [Pseudidiomarina aestuarii]RUO41629.1 hypothetical protein CWE22_05585 [Pseudidiomarina aestuarii]